MRQPSRISLSRAVHRTRTSAGMTLVEVLIATGILVFGMLGIMALLATSSRAHMNAVYETEAVQIGTSILAELRMLFAEGQIPQATLPEDAREHHLYEGFTYSVDIIRLDQDPKGKGKKGGGAERWGAEYFVRVNVYYPDVDDHRSTKRKVEFPTVMFLRNF